jgi:hypothetical protein
MGEGFKERCREISERMKGENGIEVAAGMVEGLAGRGGK